VPTQTETVVPSPSGFFKNLIFGCSGNGLIAVGEAVRSNGQIEAFKWDSIHGSVLLGFLSGGSSSVANAISGDGTTIVGTSTSSVGSRAFSWTATNGFTSLGLLPGMTSSTAAAVSRNGGIIAGTCIGPRPEAFVYFPGGGMVGLGWLNGSTGTYATGIATDGITVVGYATFANLPNQAFVYTSTFGMVSLQDWLAGHGAAVAGWKLTKASAISEDGFSVAGEGIDPSGNQEAWSCIVPQIFSFTLAGGAQLPNITTGAEGDLVSADGNFLFGRDNIFQASPSFRWSPATGGTEFPSLVFVPTACSANGSVVYGTTNTYAAESWTPLGGFAPAPVNRMVDGCSSDGKVLVGSSFDLNLSAFRWSQATGQVNLPSLASNTGATNLSCSADGNIVVGNFGGLPGEPFKWTAATGTTPLDTIIGTGFHAYNVSADGSIVTGEITTGAYQPISLGRWDMQHGLVNLGLLPANNPTSTLKTQVMSTSADADVIVTLGGALWVPEFGLLDLKQFLTANGMPIQPASTVFPSGVSADGQTIIGTYSHTNPDTGTAIYHSPFMAHVFFRPLCFNKTFTVNQNGTLTSAARAVFKGDYHTMGGTAVLVSGPTHSASFVLNPDGSFSYKPTPGFVGSDSFQYTCVKSGYASGVATANLTVSPFVFSLQYPSVASGNSLIGRIQFGSAVTSATTVALTSSNPLVVVPSTALVKAGATIADVTLTTGITAARTTTTVNASFGGVTLSTSLVVRPAGLSKILALATVFAGQSFITTVYLDGKAPAGGAVVALDPRTTSAPTAVTVPSGASSVQFACSSNVDGGDPIIYSSYANAFRSVTVQNVIAYVTSVTVPATIKGGLNGTATVKFSRPFTTAIDGINLISSDNAFLIPGATPAHPTTNNTVAIPFRTFPVKVNTPVTLTFTMPHSTGTATVILTP
jgi:uncharacterized membrane protein